MILDLVYSKLIIHFIFHHFIYYSSISEENMGQDVFANTHARVYADGTVSWPTLSIVHSTCTVKMHNFPFDSQTCQLILGSWTQVRIHVFPMLNMCVYVPFGGVHRLLASNVLDVCLCSLPFHDVKRLLISNV